MWGPFTVAMWLCWGYFFPLISLFKCCACFSLWSLAVELQGAVKGQECCRQTHCSPCGSRALFDLRYCLPAWSSVSVLTLAVLWLLTEGSTCTQLHRLNMAQKGRGVCSRAKELTSKSRNTCELHKTGSSPCKFFSELGSSSPMLKASLNVCVIPVS